MPPPNELPSSTTYMWPTDLNYQNRVQRALQTKAPLLCCKSGWIGTRHALYLFPVYWFFPTGFSCTEVYNGNGISNTLPLWRIPRIYGSMCVLGQRTLWDTPHVCLVWCVSFGITPLCLREFPFLSNHPIICNIVEVPMSNEAYGRT